MSAHQRHDSSMASQDIAEVQRRPHYRLEAVDLGQNQIGKFVDHTAERAPATADIAPVYPLVFRPNAQISLGHGPPRARPGASHQWIPWAITPAAARLFSSAADGLHIRPAARFAESLKERMP